MAHSHEHGHGADRREGGLHLRHRHADDDGHGHGHKGHDHAAAGHAARPNQRRLLAVILFGLVLLVAEVVAGLAANSLVLLSDAAHVSTDVAAVGLAYAAIRIGQRPPDSRRTYGYYRAETVAAFVNALALWGISAYLVWEAWQRLRAPPEVDGPLVVVVGGVGLLANLVMAAFLHAGHQNLNVRSAYLHVLSDALGSVAAVVAGLGVWLYGARWLDPVATLAVAVLIVLWTWRLTRDTLHILLEGTPARVEPEEVRRTIERVPGVRGVHDLHVWSLTTGVDNLSAHVRVEDATQGPAVVRAVRELLVHEHGLSHVTIEIEADESDCVGCN